jgi:hypothetical protein
MTVKAKPLTDELSAAADVGVVPAGRVPRRIDARLSWRLDGRPRGGTPQWQAVEVRAMKMSAATQLRSGTRRGTPRGPGWWRLQQRLDAHLWASMLAVARGA